MKIWLTLAFAGVSATAFAADGAWSSADAEFGRLRNLHASDLRAKVEASASPRTAALDVEKALDRLPPISLTKRGLPDSPVNLLFFGSEDDVRRAIVEAGWTEATRSVIKSMFQGAIQLVAVDSLDVFPPVSPEYLLGRPQDLSFVRQIDFPEMRHHFRLWRAPFDGPDGQPAWIGTANFDESLQFVDRHTKTVQATGVVHRIDPKIDQERDYIQATLGVGSFAANTVYAPHPHGVRAGEDSNGNPYETDGRVLVMFLQNPAAD